MLEKALKIAAFTDFNYCFATVNVYLIILLSGNFNFNLRIFGPPRALVIRIHARTHAHCLTDNSKTECFRLSKAVGSMKT